MSETLTSRIMACCCPACGIREFNLVFIEMVLNYLINKLLKRGINRATEICTVFYCFCLQLRHDVLKYSAGLLSENTIYTSASVGMKKWEIGKYREWSLTSASHLFVSVCFDQTTVQPVEGVTIQ